VLNEKYRVVLNYCFFVIIFCESDLSAQAAFMRQKGGTWIAGEVNFLDMSKHQKDFSGWNAEVHLKLRTSDNIYLLAELPIGHGKIKYEDFYTFEKSETAIGNPYVGFQFITSTPGFSFNGGVRILIADEDKVYTYYPSFISDFERY